MAEYLVTGGTGTLGRPITEQLRKRGQSVRVLSRSSQAGVATGDLLKGTGLGAALRSIDVVVHCATGRGDARATKNLVNAALAAGSPRLVYISIVGVDRIPFPYYREKLEAERLIEQSGLPFTTLRATQFHNLVAGVFNAQRHLPVLFTPSCSVQPINVNEVATRLVDLAMTDAAGRVADIGGPETRTGKKFAEIWLAATGRKRAILPLRFPGKAFRAFRAGEHIAPHGAVGSGTFEQFLNSAQFLNESSNARRPTAG